MLVVYVVVVAAPHHCPPRGRRLHPATAATTRREWDATRWEQDGVGGKSLRLPLESHQAFAALLYSGKRRDKTGNELEKDWTGQDCILCIQFVQCTYNMYVQFTAAHPAQPSTAWLCAVRLFGSVRSPSHVYHI